MKQKIIHLMLLTLLLISCGQIAVSVDATSTPAFELPDLVVSFINVAMVDSSGRCVDGYQLFTSILNQGNAPADGVTAVETSTGHTFVIGRLDAGQKIDLQIPATSMNGMYLVNVDPQNVVPESNETNNNLSYLLPTPTPYVGCMPSSFSDATPTPVPDIPPFSAGETPTPVFALLSTSMDGLIYADMNKAVVVKVINGYSVEVLQGTSANFSPDGLQALFESSGDILLAEPMDIPGINITKTPNSFETAPQWWPANPSKVIFNVVDVNEAQEKGWTHAFLGYPGMMNKNGTDYVKLAEAPSLTQPAMSPDGKTIAFDINGWPTLYEIGLGQRTFDPAQYGFMGKPLEGIRFTSPSFSPDGRYLTWWVSQDESMPQRVFSLVMFDLVGRTNTTLHSYSAPSGTLGWLSSPVWSPSGEWIAFQTYGEFTPRDLWIVHQAGGIGQCFGLAANPVWSPDSQHLAYVQWPPQSDSYLAASLSIIDVPSWNIQQTSLPAGSIPLGWRYFP